MVEHKNWIGRDTFIEMCRFLEGRLDKRDKDVSCRVKETDISLSRNERHVDVSIHKPRCLDAYAHVDNVGKLMLDEGDKFFKKHAFLQPKHESGEGIHISPDGDVELLTRTKSLSVDI